MNANIDENIKRIGLLVAIIGLMVAAVITVGLILTLFIQQSKTNEIVTIEGKVMIAQAEEDSYDFDKLHFVELNEGVAIKAVCYELDPNQWENNYSRVRCFTLVTTVGRDGYSFEFERDPNSNYKIDYNLYVDPDWLQPIEEVNRRLTTQIPAGTVENNITGPTFYLVLTE